MKKLLIASMLSVMCAAPAFAQDGYLTDNSGAVVKSGSGLCWNAKSTFSPREECGDVVEQPKKVEEAVKPQVIPGLAVKQELTQQKVVIDAQVLFGFDSFRLSKAGEEALLKEVVAVNPVTVEVAGYTDSIGTRKYNQKLSQKRAEVVKKFLVSKGIAADKIVAVGFGENNLICEEKHPTKSSKCAAQNRRVEITTEYVRELK